MARQRPVHAKPLVYRRAVASGSIRLRPATLRAVREHRVEKGDPIAAGEIAGLVALKQTPLLLPHCHPVPITGSRVEIRPIRGGLRATAEVEAIYRTGVEMEALTGVAVALLTVWDMLKYLEKDARGQYPATRIEQVKVVTKVKAAAKESPR